MSIILPEGVPNRWQQAINNNRYLEWRSLASYLRGLSCMASADKSHCIASDLMTLAEIACWLARDMEPKELAA